MATPTIFNMADSYPKSVYRPEIDGLRALAVIAVITNHFNSDILSSGYLGVDIFFVISGFVITSSLADRNSNTFGDLLLTFYVRRIKRLVPALVLFVVISGVIICMLNPSPGISLKTGIASLFGVSNIYLLRQSTDYFAASTQLNVFTHTWSLGAEEQFYLLFPFLVWFSGFCRLTTNGRRSLFWATAALTVASLIGFVLLYQSNQPAAYFLMPTRLWELGAGCLLFLGLNHSNAVIRRLESIPPLLSTIGIIGVLFVPLNFAVPATIAIVVLTVILIASLRSGTIAYAIFTRQHIVFVGLISYSLYLWHWAVLSLSQWTIGIHWWSAPFQVALMFLFAIISYRFIETPLRRADWSARRVLSVGYGVCASAAACGLLFVLSEPLDGRLYLGRLLNIPAPPNLQQTWWIDRKTGKYLERCHIPGEFSSAILKECLNIASGKKGNIYLIGGSHARNYLPALQYEFREHSVAYITMGSGCAFLPPALSDQYSNVRCFEYVTETTKYLLQKATSGDVVFIGQRLFGRDERVTPLYVDFIKYFAVRLGENGVRVVMLDGTFPPEKEPELCVDLPWRPSSLIEGCSVVSETVTKAFARFDQLALDASSHVENLYYTPLRTGLCHEGVCGQTTATGLPIWHDRGHITEGAAAQLTPLLHAQLARQGFYRRFSADR